MITDLVNQITVQGVISAEWQLIVNCYKEKGDALERENYRGGLKLTDQILKIAEKVLETLIRQQVDTNEV